MGGIYCDALRALKLQILWQFCLGDSFHHFWSIPWLQPFDVRLWKCHPCQLTLQWSLLCQLKVIYLYFFWICGRSRLKSLSVPDWLTAVVFLFLIFSYSQAQDEGRGDILEQLEMKRTWESGNHPYLFFNEDGETFSPLGFFVENIGTHESAYFLNDIINLINC